ECFFPAFSATLCRSRAPAAGMSKRQNSHSVRTAALCCSQRARNVISPLSPLGRIARIADSNCPSRRRELHKIPLWLRDAVSLRDLRSEIDWFRFLRLFDAGGLILDENRPLHSLRGFERN